MPKSQTKVAKAQQSSRLTPIEVLEGSPSPSQKIASKHLRDLFAADPKRGKQMTVEAMGLFF